MSVPGSRCQFGVQLAPAPEGTPTFLPNRSTVRLTYYWERVSQSLWFIPTVVTLVAAGAAFFSIELDRRFGRPDMLADVWFVFDVGADGARGVLTGIAQSVITVTGVVFSVTIVALQLAATQFTPRVLRSFLSDRGNQWVLGIFIGTFTYTLLVVRTVGSPVGRDDDFVPAVSVTVAIALSLVSIGALIFFINHIAQSIRASVILQRVTEDAKRVIEELFPESIGHPADVNEASETPPEPVGPGRPVLADHAGYLQSVNEDELFSIAEEGRAAIGMAIEMGEFVFVGEPLATLWFDDDESRGDVEEVERKIRAAFVLGNQWTISQDLERALVELTDIAVRALSPSLNDPTTAAQCVDRLGELLILLGSRKDPRLARTGEAGKVRFIARRLPWDRAVEVSFQKIRPYAAGAPDVLIRMLEVCGRVRAQVPPRRRLVLDRQVEEVLEAARMSDLFPSDLRRVESAADTASMDLPGRSSNPASGALQGVRAPH